MRINQLKYRSELETILANYKVSNDGLKLLERIRLVLLSGPSAVGRNTIINELLKTGGYHFIVSDTTRKPRINNGLKEKNGLNYWFRSEEDMLKDLRQGRFLEAEIIHDQQVSGISMRELKQAQLEKKIAVKDIEIGGFKNVSSIKPDTVSIIILPPSFKEWLRRLTNRGEMPKDEVIGRLKTGYRIFSEALQNNNLSVVVNDKLDSTAREIDFLARGGQPQHKQSDLELLSSLLEQTNEYLLHMDGNRY
jgi:guanylate kinase